MNAFFDNSQNAFLPFESGSQDKRCPDCGLVKVATEFRRNAALPDGLAFYCKACARRRDAASYRQRRQAAGFEVRDRIEVPDGHLRCSLCATIKPIDNFDRAPYQSNGRSSW